MRTLLFFILFMVLMASFGKQGGFTFYQLKRHEQSLARENEALAQKNRELAREINRLKEPAYLERTIREELGYARDDELLFE